MEIRPVDDVYGLDSFFATYTTNIGTSLPGNVLAQLNDSTPPQCPDYNELRKQLFDIGSDADKHADTTNLDNLSKLSEYLPQNDIEELELIKKYTTLGFNKIIEHIKRYLELNEKLNTLNKEIDKIYKGRNDVIGNVRTLAAGDHLDKVSNISESVESLIMSIIEHKSQEKQEIEKELDGTKAILTFLNETYKIHKHAHSYIVCPICMNQEVSMYLIPCGHAYCKNCSSKMTRCAVCNGSITSKGKLFI